jgi:hypothetical protein
MDVLFSFSVLVKSSVPVLMYVECVYNFQSHVWDQLDGEFNLYRRCLFVRQFEIV